ncbi:putative serine/threonine-protein kinase receptor [Hordeum vulgare]|nr:putative serine/threonine-protein kinase receptor [Hordeum vulgare]
MASLAQPRRPSPWRRPERRPPRASPSAGLPVADHGATGSRRLANRPALPVAMAAASWPTGLPIADPAAVGSHHLASLAQPRRLVNHPASSIAMVSPRAVIATRLAVTRSGRRHPGSASPGPPHRPAHAGVLHNLIANLTACKLVLTRDGNLAVHHQATTVWSTKANVTANTAVAALLDNGSLVLRSGGVSNSFDVFWQSYDHPTDTVLQGGKIGWNNSTGMIRRLVSRKNAIDQTPGMYSYELLGHNGDTSIFSMFKSSKQYWSSGKWGGQYFSNIPESVGQKWLSLQFTNNKEE